MKNNKLIIILAFIILLPLSWYKLYTDSQSLEKQYNQYLDAAREKANMGITKSADEFYLKALDVYNSYDIQVERINMYWDNQMYRKYEELCKKLIDAYPKKAEGYELLSDYYYREGSYKEIYQLQDSLNKRKKTSDKLDKLCKELENQYSVAMGCSYQDMGYFYNGYSIVSDKEGALGYINTVGEVQISCKYAKVSPFNSDGYAGVTTAAGESYIIDRAGDKQFVDPQERKITDIKYICMGYSAMQVDGKYHISDLKFNMSEKSFDDMGTYDGNYVPVCEQGKWFFVNIDGEKISDHVYEDIIMDEKGIAFNSGVAFVKTDGSYIMIDTEEKQVGNDKFDDAHPFYTGEDTAIKQNNLWGFINTKGEITIKPQYMDARPFSNGYAAVNTEGIWSFINKANEAKIIGDFTDAKAFSSSMTSAVLIDGKWKVIKILKNNH